VIDPKPTLHFPAAAYGLVLALSALVACGRSQAPAQPPPPKVGVATVIYKPVAQWDEFTGRVAAVDAVELRPRVGGYIDKVNFAEGQEVAKGDVLFAIDPRNYQAEVDRAKAELNRAQSRDALARSEAERARKLAEAKVVSTEMYDQRAAAAKQAGSDILAAKAQLEIAQLNLSYTQVRAPISGRAGRALVTVGNLAAPNETVLTTLVSLDPAYVYFEGDEGTYLRYAAQVRSGETASPRTAHTPVRIGLANEAGYPHPGYVDFVDNQLDQGTGTIRARAVLDNKARVFTPGLFARVQMLGGAAKPTVLIDDKAVLTDQDRKYVYVVDRNNTAERRDIRVGRSHERLRVVSTGLKPGDRIVVHGVQKVFFSGMKVDPIEIEMGAPAPDLATMK
jgi:multidrug efflux system membrane fusion protein